jgi:hypothetical protein
MAVGSRQKGVPSSLTFLAQVKQSGCSVHVRRATLGLLKLGWRVGACLPLFAVPVLPFRIFGHGRLLYATSTSSNRFLRQGCLESAAQGILPPY